MGNNLMNTLYSERKQIERMELFAFRGEPSRKSADLLIDATEDRGRLGRLILHADPREANCRPQTMVLPNGRAMLLFRSTKTIEAGNEDHLRLRRVSLSGTGRTSLVEEKQPAEGAEGEVAREQGIGKES